MKRILAAICLLGVTYTLIASQAVLSGKKLVNMKAFVVLVKVPVTYTAEQAKAVGPQWEKTIAAWKASGSYITSYAFPGESAVIEGDSKTVSLRLVAADGKRLVSNVLLRAETPEQAAALAGACPVLNYGGSVEVREITGGEPVLYH